MARLSRLCDLISTSLETSACVQSRVSEKHLLLSLSSLYKEIQKLCQLQDLEDETPVTAHKCVVQTENLEGNCKCLANVVLSMVNFFEHDSEFVQHLTSNILFTIFTSLIEADGIWVKFLQFVWITLVITMLSICGAASPCSQFQSTSPLKEVTTHKIPALDMSSSEIESFVSVLQSAHANPTSKTALGLFQMLHKMGKYLKNKVDQEGELGEKFILLSVKFLHNIPWDHYSKTDFGSSKMKAVLSGCMLQFICSLIQKNDFEDSQNSVMEVSNSHRELGDLVPKFLSSFFGLSDGEKHLVQYMKHKTLMLMIRLSFYPHQNDTSRIILWLRFLKEYFPDLLYKPFSNYTITPKCCLEESPFFPSFADKLVSLNTQTWHLQRQALLVFFKSCFGLIQTSSGIEKEQCLCGKEASLIDCGTPFCCCCCGNIGLSEMSDWLKCAFVCQVDTSPINFGLSFLQLFMDEDDMLFYILLLLQDASLVTLHTEIKGACYNYLHLLSNIIDPVCLFHLLLLSLKYDHLVLIDYLISKDTGVLCARYLLRCLKFVSQSWQSFGEFSVPQLQETDSSNKRPKLANEVCDASTSSKAFVDAKQCLVSLKNTLEDLHRKNLFPYNPKALLRSLSRFQELCQQ
ncbi:hypothetical protein LUZ62_052099 [Rhynchospora pubera]|uniref:Protein Lines C-terminal domain-containing protein n=1 Tax=Rhynchospora pubera TaxID=906938 RepID=A0AAV8GDA6_9POAL|nr:hypothetical protein LUZ62_052099 [Rhynchospora pubera]